MYIQLIKLKEAIIRGEEQNAINITDEVLKEQIGSDQIIETVINPVLKTLATDQRLGRRDYTKVCKSVRILHEVNTLLSNISKYN